MDLSRRPLGLTMVEYESPELTGEKMSGGIFGAGGRKGNGVFGIEESLDSSPRMSANSGQRSDEDAVQTAADRRTGDIVSSLPYTVICCNKGWPSRVYQLDQGTVIRAAVCRDCGRVRMSPNTTVKSTPQDYGVRRPQIPEAPSNEFAEDFRRAQQEQIDLQRESQAAMEKVRMERIRQANRSKTRSKPSKPKPKMLPQKAGRDFDFSLLPEHED